MGIFFSDKSIIVEINFISVPNSVVHGNAKVGDPNAPLLVEVRK